MKITMRKKILILTAPKKKKMRVSVYKILSKSVSKLSYGKRLQKRKQKRNERNTQYSDSDSSRDGIHQKIKERKEKRK